MIYRIAKQFFLIIIDFYRLLINFKYKFVRNYNNLDKAIVIGNGPSLNAFLNHEFSEFENFDIYVCNAFAETRYYEEIKPMNYSLLDPLYFLPNDVNFHRVENTWRSILEKTNWPLKLYIPSKSSKWLSFIINKYGANPNIEFVKISTVNFKSRLDYTFYSYGVGLIASMTVVHLALNIAILNKHKEIYLAGVDQSWHENIKYDSKTHEVFIDYVNFNSYNKYVYGKDYFATHDLVDEFFSLYNSLLGFRNLEKMAGINRVKIYRTTKSYLHFLKFSELIYDRGNKE
jgi:hypothetical protein